MIPLKTRGKCQNINESIVVKVTRDKLTKDKTAFYLDEDYEGTLKKDFAANGFISVKRGENISIKDCIGISDILDLSHLDDGDIVSISPSGVVWTLFRVNSFNNALFVTERCNSNCLMCSQPPRNIDDIEELFFINSKLIDLIPKETKELGITGGEPTLLGSLFPKTIAILNEKLPNTNIHVLTNGRSFSHYEIVEDLAAVNHENLVLGIPLYSDYYQQHDYIVQAKNAFNQTITGLHNLARFNIRIEIRVVLHKLTIPRLVNLAKYIFHNLPFVEHVALMGLEHTGYTPFNIGKLWIDPIDYQSELVETVEYLDSCNMNVSIYNHQLCTIPKELWPFAKQSISAWKNDYLPECVQCVVKDSCGGLFSSSLKKHSNYIKAIKED